MKQKKNKIKEGDVIYYLTPDWVESDVAMIIEGNAITTSDDGYINVKDCLSEDDQRVVEYKSK